MDPNFGRADNSNLPKIDAFMVAHFFKNNADYYAAELKNAKTAIDFVSPNRMQPDPCRSTSFGLRSAHRSEADQNRAFALRCSDLNKCGR
ncbi:hypothetical protein EVAR_31463_1 [Eumeta japonica]|uniref:Uncharacterized protein n=1 Tax=Eumeta variegata TaxID=151549 RepID=A0A4C1WA47_EUMVA|nr:hypothetical protein EVAR_31463_1 [Eumeta japonica]